MIAFRRIVAALAIALLVVSAAAGLGAAQAFLLPVAVALLFAGAARAIAEPRSRALRLEPSRASAGLRSPPSPRA